MVMSVGTNPASLVAQRSLHESGKAMGTAMERLATGQRINSAADDAAGLAIATRMQGQISGLNSALRNTADGQALVSAIEGSLVEVEDILVRMRELSVQAASDTVTNVERGIINSELSVLKTELTALSDRTKFNDQNILDGSFSAKAIQVGANANETVSVTQSSVAATAIGAFVLKGDIMTAATGASDAAAQTAAKQANDTFTITGTDGTTNSTTFADGDDSAKAVATEVNTKTGDTGVTATAVTNVRFDGAGNAQTVAIAVGIAETSYTTLTTFTTVADGIAAFNEKSGLTGVVASADPDGTANNFILTHATGETIKLQNSHGANAFELEVGNHDMSTFADAVSVAAAKFVANNGVIHLTASKTFSVTETNQSYVGGNSATNTTVNDATLTTRTTANTAIAVMDGALEKLASMRADLGAISARLDSAMDSTIAQRDATIEARGTLVDADIANESASLAKQQVLQQVGTAMLAQANAQPQLALQLIQ
jgi:flagellin